MYKNNLNIIIILRPINNFRHYLLFRSPESVQSFWIMNFDFKQARMAFSLAVEDV